MQTTIFAIIGFIATAVTAAPTDAPYVACGGQASAYPFSVSNFRDICANGGQRARCCVVPILGQSLLCETPTGLGEQ
ncbi:hypothetical protein O1611_g8739 [Lasiodiplodia mahajangana]|uniref:Uncharacterized protein n=1 Tax=Lasiodiplodia mahajangana TaxID=1108764 RepID=A0ACC2JBU1_9PEZI|nr:hypothetical protein O1611_g8739 [Lasiodiplodia mahajangana]